MNVKRISTILTVFFVFLFSYYHNSFAYNELEYSVDPGGQLTVSIPFLQEPCSASGVNRIAILGFHGVYPTTNEGSNGSSFGSATSVDHFSSLFEGILWASTTPASTDWTVNLNYNEAYIFGGSVIDGDYWLGFACPPDYGIFVSDTSDVSNMNVVSGLHKQDGVWSGHYQISPRIESFEVSTTTDKAHITGYWIATTTPFVSQRLSFWQESSSLGKESYIQLTSTTSGFFDFTLDFKAPYSWTSSQSSTTPIYSDFTLYALLDEYDDTNYIFPVGGTLVTNLDATSTTLYASDYNASDFVSSARNLALYPEYDCDLTHLMGCLKNALIWTFYPTQDALDSWTSLKTTLETKAPVGYFYSVRNSLNGLSATSTAAFSIVIPQHLKQYIFDPFDIGIASILWFFFIFHFYKRIKQLQI